MRANRCVLAILCLSAIGLRAATVSPEEQKVQTEFNKAYNNPDKTARSAALAMLDGQKHPSSWAILDRISKTDPEAEVRLAAFTSLAKAPAHDGNVARMLAGSFSALKPNDIDGRVAYAKAMAPSEFKADLVMTIGEQLQKLRYPDIPKYIPGTGTQSNGNMAAGNNFQAAVDRAKKDRGNYEAMLEAFNGVANSEVKAATKETPSTIKKWLDANLAKIAQDDRTLQEKYRKEDAEAAKAAAEAAKAAAKAAAAAKTK